MVLKKPVMGGTVSGIIIASKPTSIGFLPLLYSFFNAPALPSCRASAFTICSIKILLKAAYREEKIHRKAEKVKENRALYRNFFDLLDLAVKISSKTW
jgi:hypothetical protein